MTTKKPAAGSGALVGLLLAACLSALLYPAARLIGLPFAPFDLFEWLTRALPGGVVTSGIDALVSVLSALGLNVATSAKAAEILMALGLFLTGGAIAGATLFALLKRLENEPSGLVGAGAGAILSIPLILTGNALDPRAPFEGPVGVFPAALGLLLATMGWGAAVGWAYRRLAGATPAPAEEPAPLSAGQLERRRFLIRLGGATAAITVVGAGLGAALTRREGSSSVAESPPEGTPTAAPSADDGLLEPAPGTRPETTPIERHYRIDINLTPPAIDEADWRLRITGMVDNPLELTLDDLRNNYEPIDRFITLECISNRIGGNLIGTTLWTGASLQAVLADAGVQEGAAYIRIHARDGFWEILPLETLYADERIMLTYGMDGQPLQQKHGFPLRIYIPDRFGMKQPKWITELEVMATYDQGYWVERGWDEEARVRATSVIDTVQAIDENTVAIGGIAYAGARGISKVEVQIDEGEWVEAQLRPPLSDTTWVIWRYDWPFEAGAHVFRVRCYEGDGTPQIEEENDPHPSGATGIHTAISNL